MRRNDVFKSKWLKADDLNGRSRVLEIEAAPLETLKNASGEQQQKVVLYFVGEPKRLPLNMTNWDLVANICGDDTDDWPNHKVELYSTTTQMGGKTVACIRIRKPRTGKAAPRTAEPPPNEDPGDGMADEVPF
jgi:hypothetical protein